MVRADAQENRARILTTAREALAEDGATSLNQIAQRAGVGPGTLYRHYPTREALLLAVYADEVDRLVTAVTDLLATAAPLEALRRWTIDLVDAMRRKHGLGDALSPSAHQAITDQTYSPVLQAITRMIDAGQRDGTIRADADARDYLQLTAALWRAPTEPEDRSPFMLDLVLAGLTSSR